MITTVTLNAAIDRTQLVPHFTPGRRHRATDSVTLAGGHGITIARALKRLGRPVAATGLIGGVTGNLIRERMSAEGLLHDFHRIRGASRTSTAVIDPIDATSTEMNEYGPEVKPDELEAFIGKLEHLARTSEIVVLAGSLPRGLEANVYQQLVRQLRGLDTQTVVTGVGDEQVLSETLQAEPSLMLVSQREAEEHLGHEFTGDSDFQEAFDAMVRVGGQSIVIATSDGVWARLKSGRMVDLFHATFEPVDSLSPLGGTDVFIAGYIDAFLADQAPDARLRHGLAVTISNQRSIGAGIFDASDLGALEQRVSFAEVEVAV